MMRTTNRFLSRSGVLLAAGTAALSLALAACGSSGHSGMPGMNHHAVNMSAATPSGGSSASGMSNMPGMATGDGLTSEKDGYRLDSRADILPAGRPTAYTFTIAGPDGKPVTDFALDQTMKLHFYAVRSDLSGYQHVHPTMAADGTWTADLAQLQPGTWRLYASFTPNTGGGKGTDFVLSRTVTVPGDAAATPLPAAATTTTADGYTINVQGDLMAGMAHPLTVSVSKDGQPVTDLQPYLDTYAHISAFHEGDQAFAHLHPEATVNGDHGGPNLTFHTAFTKPGNWRVYIQFQTAGQLHTAAITLHVN